MSHKSNTFFDYARDCFFIIRVPLFASVIEWNYRITFLKKLIVQEVWKIM